MKRVCIKCGKEIEEGILCEECRLEEGRKKEKEKSERKVIIRYCECSRYKIKRSWVFPSFSFSDLEDYQRKIIDTYFNCKKVVKINENYYLCDDNRRILFKKGLCDVCARQQGGYYELKIQLRGAEPFIREAERRILEFVERNAKNNIFVSSVNYLKEGVDIYISPRNVANKIRKMFPFAEAKISKKLHTFKDGKRIYRITLLIKGERNEER